MTTQFLSHAQFYTLTLSSVNVAPLRDHEDRWGLHLGDPHKNCDSTSSPE